MAKKHQCTTHGLDCDWTATSEDAEALVELVKEHAAEVHPQITWSDEIAERVRNGFTEE